jgi:DNA polymerase-3 subunit alpha
MEDILQETYGVTVYQEQVMRISQAVAGFSRGKADQLRKAMGKKKRDVLEGLKADFMEGALSKGYEQGILEKIWSDWEAFAKYAFNKSHAASYAWVSYQTAWLKTHYPSEFQASNLTQQSSNMEEMTKIMADCKRFGIKVLSPDVNESDRDFSVNRNGNIRYGLSGLKGFGSNVVDAIITERDSAGPFADVFDFMERLGGIVNRRALETLVCAGAFDSFGYKRSCFFLAGASGEQFIDELVRYGELYKNDSFSAAGSLFGDIEELRPQRPDMPILVGEEDVMGLLQQEKEFVGMYLSAHPLDRYAFEIKTFTNCPLKELKDRIDEANRKRQGSKISVAGIVTSVKKFITKNGRPGVEVVIEDYSGSYVTALYAKDCEKFLPFMAEHSQIYIDAEIALQRRPRQEDISEGKVIPYVFKIKDVRLLGNIGEERIKSFAININTASLSSAFRKSLIKILKEYSGHTRLCVTLFDKDTGYRIETVSKKYNVCICEDFLLALEHLEISYLVTK